MTSGRTQAVVNDHEIVTGEFTRNTEFRILSSDLRIALQARLRDGVHFPDASESRKGRAWGLDLLQHGASGHGVAGGSRSAVGSRDPRGGAPERAGVEANLRAFDLGRWAQHDPAAARALMVPKAAAPVDPVAFRVDHLRKWQDDALAERYVQREIGARGAASAGRQRVPQAAGLQG